MARRERLASIQQISDINLTPLMDLTFILLITFIITFPLLEQGVPLDLPRADAEALEDLRSYTVSIDADGAYYLDRQPLTKPALADRLQDLSAAFPDVTVLLRVDQSIEYGAVMEVIRLLREAEITQLALVTQAETQ